MFIRNENESVYSYTVLAVMSCFNAIGLVVMIEYNLIHGVEHTSAGAKKIEKLH